MSPAKLLSARGKVILLVIALTAVCGASLRWNGSFATQMQSARRALDAGDLDKAVQTAQALWSTHPDSFEGCQLAAEAGYLARDPGVWKPAFAALESSNPQHAFELWLKLGGIEMQRFQAAAAETALRRAIYLNADRPEPWRLLFQLISIQGRPADTVACLIALIRLEDFTRDDLALLAWPNSSLGDIQRVDQLLNADPNNLVPMLAHVVTALNSNRMAEAEQLLQSILRQHPEQPQVIAMLGRLLAERNAPEFLDWQQNLSAEAATEPEAWIAQGLWLRQHGQTEAAAAAFHEAMKLDPRHQNALTELGTTLQSFGETTLANEFLNRARLNQDVTEFARRTNESDDPQNTFLLIERLEQAGRLWEAWGWCRDHSRHFPNDATTQQKLAQLKSRLTPALPRTDPTTMPGVQFAWENLSRPIWQNSAESLRLSERGTTSTLAFKDEAQHLGLHFHYENGPPRGKTIVQTSGGGVGALDYDRDGWCDLYFTQGGKHLHAAHQTEVDALFRNLGGDAFENVAGHAGLNEDHFSQGVAAGDINNDGFPDLYVANLGRNRLWQNNGDGTFTDITTAAGLSQSGWTISTAIADFTGDGDPELFSVRYATGEDITTRVCQDQSGVASVCRPTVFTAETDLIAINQGDGRFHEQCSEAGLDLPEGRGFGIVAADFNNDDRLDAFIANDQTANFLFLQDGSTSGPLHFQDEALQRGVAFDRDGYPQACMGVASGDVNRDGRTDLFVTNFADESDTLYLSHPHGYLDVTRAVGLRDPSFKPLGFGTQFLDADLDGWLDLVVLNGHINDLTEIGQPPAMLPQLFRGLADGHFVEIPGRGPEDFFQHRRVGRGLAVLDWNRDGRPDFAGSFLDDNAVLATNHTQSAGSWATFEFVGITCSRDAVGTKVQISLDDGSVRHWQITAGDGFAASNQRRWHLGLGSARITAMDIRWASGAIQHFGTVRQETEWVVIEGRETLVALPSRDAPSEVIRASN